MSKRRATDIPNKAYVTYIGAGNEDELKGVAGLAKGLRQSESKYPLVVAIPSNLYEKHRKSLESQGCLLEKIDPISVGKEDDASFNCYYKLRLWELKKYSRMIYLNADVQVYDNIDYLMDVPEGSCFAVTGCFCEQIGTEIGIGTGTGTGTGTRVGTGTGTGVGTRTSTGTGVGTGTGTGTGTQRSKSKIETETGTGIGSKTGTGSKQPNTYSLSRCQKCPNTVTEPDEGGLPSPLYFNLGLVVFKPDPKTYDYLRESLRDRTTSTVPPSRLDNSGAMTSKYRVISLKDYVILDTPLPRHLTKDEQEKAKVVHYRAVESKPWKKENKLEKAGIQILEKKWWDIFNKPSDVKKKK